MKKISEKEKWKNKEIIEEEKTEKEMNMKMKMKNCEEKIKFH